MAISNLGIYLSIAYIKNKRVKMKSLVNSLKIS